jgi:hypothetical protein
MPKQQTPQIRYERFAQAIAAGLKPGDAYKEAGFEAKNPDSARASGSRLKKQMQWRIAEILGRISNDGMIRTVAQSVEEFQKDIPWCRQKLHDLINDGDCPHSVRLGAIKECLNRGLGLPIQYVEQNLNVRYQISDRELTEEEWFARYAKPVELLPEPTEPTEH